VATARRPAVLATLVFLALPVVVVRGRPRQMGCDPPLGPTPCDPVLVSPGWAPWAFLSVLLVAAILGAAAAVKGRWITATWAAIGGLVIALELVYVGAGYVLSSQRPRDALVALAPVLATVVGGLWASRRTIRGRSDRTSSLTT
jgi:hypothetical protein